MIKVDNDKHELKPQQTALLVYIRNHHQAIFSGILSTMAIDLNYKVTDKTQFSLSADLTSMTITELENNENNDPEASSSTAAKTSK